MFFLANVNSRRRPSVVCLSVVCNVGAPVTLLRRLEFSAMFLRRLVRWTSIDFEVKFYGDRPREPLRWGC